MARRALVAGVALALIVVSAAVWMHDPTPASPWRHLYHLPVAAAALGLGVAAGAVAAIGAVLALSPLTLAEIERAGVTAAALEGLLTLGQLLAGAALAGTLAARARRQRARYETLLAVQRALADTDSLDAALARLRVCLTARLGAHAVGLVARRGDGVVVTGGGRLAPGSLAAQAIERARPVFQPDVGGSRRPRRALAVPLLAGGGVVGALALEREGDITEDERQAVAALGAHVGQALENARLAARQREFADELARKVAEATRRLEETDRMKSEFVAIASHELRTPLTALGGFAELLATRRFAQEEVTRLAGVMLGETERLSRIVSDLLDLSRLERGLTPSLRRATVEVAPVITGALAIFRRASARHRIDVDCGEPLPKVNADPDALDRILKNLVSNAMKYSPPGSVVRVRARPAPDAVAVEVEDEGEGIPVEDLARVFEPYYRTPRGVATARGTGLGLAVVKALVDAHGGSIRAENVAPGGARITLLLPAVP